MSYEEDYNENYCEPSGSVEEDNGTVHYYDEEGFEVETFTPDWGC